MTQRGATECAKPGALALLLSSVLTLSIFPASFAQEQSGDVLRQLERKEITPEKKPPEPVLVEKEKEPPAKVEEGERIFVKQFNVQGATLIDAETLTARVAPFENRELTLQEIKLAAEMITNEYRRQGYLIVYAFIPPQEIREGIVRISIVEGRLGDIVVSGNTRYSSSFIQRHLERPRQEPSPTVQTIKRALLILNEYPSLAAKASLKAGKQPGTADMTVEVTDSWPISGGITYDNFGSRTVSKNRIGAWLHAGSLIAEGDLLMLRGVTGLDRIDLERLAYGKVEYAIPLTFNGTKLGAHLGNDIYEAAGSLTPLGLEGESVVAGVYVSHPIRKDATGTLEARFGFDYKDLSDYMLDSLNSRDKLRVFDLGATYRFFDRFQGSNFIGLSLYQGVRNLFGGTGKDDPGTSRPNADGAFTKCTADVVRVQKLPGYTHLRLRASGQVSWDRLFTVEQFGIGGMGTVRGFTPFLFSGDSGYALSAELQVSPIAPETRIFNWKLGDMLRFAFFADHGGVYRNDAQPGENTNDFLTSIGAGIRLYLGERFSLLLDWAVPNIGGTFKTGDSVTYVQAMVSF